MKIRLAKDKDYVAMARLRRQTIRHVNAKDYSKAAIRRWAAEVGAKDLIESAAACKRWVALDKDKIIGFCEHDFKGKLSRIYVHKDYLRKEIGSRLLAIAEASLEKQGFKKIVVKSTVTAKAFYEKHGYKVIRKALHKEDRAPIYKMLKKI
ncbi:MAG: GNAT family N-acetyltransferase [Proteobacteria bacterium]|nr:GNAT family N-acetyltransferase [Pseudomonadota bacterium]